MNEAQDTLQPAPNWWIGIDARSLKSGPAGIATYVANLTSHLPELIPIRLSRPRNNLFWNQTVPLLNALIRGWRLYHAPCYTGPLVLPCPLVVTAPDVSYLVNPDWYPHSLGMARLNYYRASLRRADRIIVTSEFSKAELARVLPEVAGRIRRTYLAVSTDFRKDHQLAQQARERFSLPGEFLLHVGDIHQRRNLPLLRRVSECLSLPLVLVGRILQPELFESAGSLHFQNLTLQELVGFYSAASVFVYASHYEGFGLPLLEALACDLPIVAAKTSSIPEVCGDAAILVAMDADDFVRGVEQALAESPALITRGRNQLSAFSWLKTAQATREVYRELVDFPANSL